MLRKISFLLFLLLPLTIVAQDFRFGHINRQLLLEVMPEAAEAQRELENLVLRYRMESSNLETELQTRLRTFQETQAALDPATRALREAELNSLYVRIQEFNAMAQEDLQRRQMELMFPIETRINDAIRAVGEENGFTYIFDIQAQAILFFSSQSVDVLPLVKRRMNL